MRAAIAALAFCLLASAAPAQTAPDAMLGTGRTSILGGVSTVSVNVGSPGATIPNNFVGLSIEVGDLIGGYYQGATSWSRGNASSFINLMKLLGPNGVLRVGGSTSSIPTTPALTQPIATSLAAFTAAVGAGWSNIRYTLDLPANNSSLAATQAGYLTTAFGIPNVVFQFGNEPSLNGYTAAAYATAWNAYYTAVSTAVSGAKFAAFDDVINAGFGKPHVVAATLTPGLAGLTELTMHFYSFCNGAWSTPLPAYLIASLYQNEYSASVAGGGWLGGANQGLGYLSETGLTGGVPQRMSETNNICLAGELGLSDRLIGMAEMLNEEIILANAGWVGLNFHQSYGVGSSGVAAVYNPMVQQADGGFSPNATFYAMYLFAQIEGQQIVPSAVGGSGNVAAIATLRTTGKANIIVVNNDTSNPAHITPAQSSTWSTATVLKVRGAGACLEASPTMGDAAIGEGGSWAGAPFTISNGMAIHLGPCEAALISIQ